MTQDRFVDSELTERLLKLGAPLDKMYREIIGDIRPKYYTLPYDDPNWVSCDCYYRPTFNQVHHWLMDKVFIFVNVSFTAGKFTSWVKHINNGEMLSDNLGYFNSYDEAFEMGIYESINFISKEVK